MRTGHWEYLICTFLLDIFAASTIWALVVCCFRFCSDTFGSDPPLNAPKFVAGARVFFDCETT